MKKNRLYLKKNFSRDFENCLKKLGLNKTKNLFLTSNLESISKIRIKKNDKLKILLEGLKNNG